jgi:hypothetical protein
MKPHLPLLAATCAAVLAGCADSNWFQTGGKQPEYTPMQGGPGYGPTGPLSQYNAVPEGPPPVDYQQFNSDSLGGYGGGGYGTGSQLRGGSYGGTSGTGNTGMSGSTGEAGAGSAGSQATSSSGGAGGFSNEPGIGSGSAAGRDSAGSTGAAGAASSGAPLDQQSACELQRRVSAARTPEERQALMEQAMPGMTPETQERHLQMMRESCQ